MPSLMLVEYFVFHSLFIIGVSVSVFELPPGQHLSEAEEYEGGEGVSGFTAVETDSEAATPPVVSGGGHEVVVSAGFHSLTNLI